MKRNPRYVRFVSAGKLAGGKKIIIDSATSGIKLRLAMVALERRGAALDQAPEGFAIFNNKEDDCVKIVLNPN